MNTDKTISTGRMPPISSLTGMKAIAMFLIFCWHSNVPRPPADMGARMCEILFVISGFLVGYNYYHKNVPATWKESFRYSLSKLIKFWPLHILALLLMIFAVTKPEFSLETVITASANALLLHAWSASSTVFFSYNGATWFLSALIFCYFMSPMLLKFAKNVKLSTVLFFAVWFVRFAAEYISRHYGSRIWTVSIHSAPVIRCMEYFMGMLLVPLFFCIFERIKDKKCTLVFSIIEILATGLTAFFLIWKNGVWQRSEFVALFAVFVFIFSFNKGIFSKILSLKPFEWFSSIQLEFFVLHVALILSLADICRKITPNWIVMNILLLAIVIVCSFLYKRFLSRPLASLMKRIINKFCALVKLDFAL